MGVGRSEASRHNQTPPSSCRSLYPSATSSPSISLLLFLLVFIILRIQLVLADPCSVPSPTLAKNVLECYQSFSLPDAENTRSLAITAVRSYLELYPYLTLQRTAGSYDIIGELESIRTNTAIDTEFALQAAITRAFTLLHDAHTVYNADCFSVYQFLQPWIIKPVYNSHASLGSMARKPRLFLGGMIDDGIELGYFLTRINSTRATGIVAGMMEIWREELKADPRDFLNYEVVAIDGRDPVDTVQSFANEMVGLSRDPNARFNAALGRSRFVNGAHRLEEGAFVTSNHWPLGIIPEVRTYTLRSPPQSTAETNAASEETVSTLNVTVPWLAYFVPEEDVRRPFPTPLTSTFLRRTFCGDPGYNLTGDIVGQQGGSQWNRFRHWEANKERSMRLTSTIPSQELMQHPFSAARFFEYRGLAMASSADPALLHAASSSGPTFAVGRQFKQNFLSTSAVFFHSIHESSTLAAYYHNLTRTAIIVIPTFDLPTNSQPSTSPSPSTEPSPQTSNTPIDEAVGAVASAIRRAVDAGAEHLVMDLSGNAGGNICFGRRVAALLVPKMPYAQYDVRMTASQRFLMRNAGRAYGATTNSPLSPSLNPFDLSWSFPVNVTGLAGDGRGYVDVDTVRASVLSDPLPIITRGGDTGEAYSRRFVDICVAGDVPRGFSSAEMQPSSGSGNSTSTIGGGQNGEGVAENQGTGPSSQVWPHGPSKIAIVTDGLCGSTCAMLVKVMRKNPEWAGGGAKTYVYGGRGASSFQSLKDGMVFQPTSFEGGRVLDHDEAWKASQDILLGVALSSGNSSSGGGVGEIVGGVLADDGILMPRVLPWPAVLRFLHREGYTAAPPAPESGENGRNATLTPEPPVIIPDETLPDEFIRDLADAWLNVQDPMDVTGVWVATIEQLTGLNVTELVGTPKPTTSALPPGGGDEDDMEAASRRKEMRARERVLMGVGIAVGLAVVISVVAAMFIIAARRKRMKEGGGGGMMKGEGGTTASESVDEIEGRQLARLDGPSVWRVRTL